MPVSNFMPDVVVEIAFDSGYLTPAASRTWTDVSAYVEAQNVTGIQRGRGDEQSTVQPSRLTVTLDNTDGRFTPENAAGAYYPNVKKGRPIRVRVQRPLVEDFADAAGLTLGSASTVAGGVLTSNGGVNGYWWFTGAEWVAGDFTVTYEAQHVTARDIFNFGFWMTDTTSSSAYDGYMFRLDTNANETGFFQFTNGVHGARLSPTSPAGMPTATWMRVTLSAVASTGTVTVSVVNVATSAVLYSETLVLPGGNRSGTFGQKHDALGSGSHEVDNVTLSSGGPYTSLFTGYVDEWPVEWPDGTDAMSTVTVTAMSRMARLGRTAELKSIVEEEILYDDPVLYFPLSEPSGSTTAGNIAPGRRDVLTVTQVGTGGTLEFGNGIGPGTDDLSAVVLTPVDTNNGQMLATTLLSPVYQASDTAVELEAWIIHQSGGSTGGLRVVSLGVDGVSDVGLKLMVSSTTGEATANISAVQSGFTARVFSSSTSVLDGNLHHLVAKFVISGGNVTPTIIVDGVATVGASAPLSAFPAVTRLWVGGAITGAGAGMFQGTIAHAAVYASSTAVADARFVQHFDAGDDGAEGESSDVRIDRYARLAGIPTAEVSTGTGLSTSIAHKDTTGESPLSLMEAVAQTEDGVLFDAGDGTLTFHARSHRYGSTSAFTLDCEAGDIEADYSPKLDDQHLSNDVTASRPDGIKIRSTNEASITEYGYYRDTLEILTTSDNEVQARADWQVQRFGTPRVTVPNVSVDLISCSAALIADLLAADIGTRFTVTNLPSQAPATIQDFFVEGITYDIGAESFRISFNTSAADYANVWTLNSATLSQLDQSTTLAY